MSIPVLLATLLQLAYQTSGTPVMASERTDTYDITATTSTELKEEILEHGPTDPATGMHFTGDLRWELHWPYTLQEGPQGCHLGRLDVRIDTVMTLPRWTNLRQGSESLQTGWDLFLSRLKEHEAGHRSNAVKAAQAVREAIESVASMPQCASMQPLIDRAAQAAFEHWKQLDADYDSKTRHGETQGAVLP